MFGMVKRTETQTVHRGDWPRAHGENVAQNAADASRRALKRLDERRMIVRLNFERDAPAVADVDNAGVFPGWDHDAFSGRRQPAQVNGRRLVGTVFRPHDGENAELGKRRLASHQRLDAFKLWRG